MKFQIIFLIILGVTAPRIIFSQTKNRISFQTGLFHYFFDKAPLTNRNYLDNYSVYKPLGGFFINSFGISYLRNLKTNSAFTIELDVFNEGYNKHVTEKNLIKVAYLRQFLTTNSSYRRSTSLNEKFSLNYGIGLNHRWGYETIIINRNSFELNLINIFRNDLGLNIYSGIDYSPNKWITFYSKIDFLSLFYIHDKESKTRLKEIYGLPQFPSRFDLSWRFGVGFNF